MKNVGLRAVDSSDVSKAFKEHGLGLVSPPTSGLDAMAERTVMNALQRAAPGRTTLIIDQISAERVQPFRCTSKLHS